MPVPIAVAPSVKSPGLFLTVDLLGATANAGQGTLRALLIGPKSTAGNITADTEVRTVFGPDDVAVSHGPGSPVHLAAKRLFAQHALASVDVVAPAAPAGVAATAQQVFSGSPTTNSAVRFRVHGRIIDVSWNAGETVAQFLARAATIVNGRSDDIAVTVAANAPNLDYTAKLPGTWGNDIRINASFLTGGAGATITTNPATLTAGTLDADYSAALAIVAAREYRRIIGCCGNTEATNSSATSNPGRILSHIIANSAGSAAKLQVGAVGHTGVIADAIAGAVARNSERMQYVYGQGFEDLPAELAGAEAGDTLRFVALRANYNRIGNRLRLYGPKDVVVDKPTPNELESLLGSGVSPLDIESLSGEIYTARPITTHSLLGTAADYRAFDLSDVDGAFFVADDLRVSLPTEFAHCSIAQDLGPSGPRLPPGVIERRDVEAFVRSRVGGVHVQLGVVDGAKYDARVAAGELIVTINAQDPSQVDIFVPVDIVKPLAKLGVVVSKRS